MTKKRLLREYKRSIKSIRAFTDSVGLSDNEFDSLFNDCLSSIENDDRNIKTKRNKKNIILWFIWSLIVTGVILYVVNYLFSGKPFSFVFCKIQELIYPGLRLLRIISIPVISYFPSLTELYDETCLIQNPYFRITNMDCWPCNSIRYVTELTSNEFDPNSSPPFVFKTDQKEVTFEDLQTAYKENKNVFDKDAYKITVNNKNTMLVSKFFTDYKLNGARNKAGNSFTWRLNRMFPAQLIRALFPRPEAVPRLGLSTERFVTIDESGTASYSLTDPECNFVFVIQGRGERLIELQPAPECQGQCSPISILLTPPYLLWYNWWYWRPVSHPTNSNITSISYMGSYC